MVKPMVNPADHYYSATSLLAEARQLYDDPTLPFARTAAHDGWRHGFASGADWMRLVMNYVRGEKLPEVQVSFQQLGFVKYGLAGLGALSWLLIVIALQIWSLVIGVVFVFYAIEAQMVFLFPLALDGQNNLFSESRIWTVRAGGTIRVMWTVMRLAVTMIFGGFVGRGFIRSWALGCMSVVLWYEKLKNLA